MKPVSRPWTGLAHRLTWLLLIIVGTGWAPLAAAAANCSGASGQMSFPDVTILTGQSPAVGTVLATSNPVTITFNCTGLPITTKSPNDYIATVQAGQTLATLDATNVPAGPGIRFKTGVTGVALLVTATPVQASSESGNVNDGPNSQAGYPVGSVTAPGGSTVGSYSGSTSATYVGQLIVTGPITAGTIKANTLIPFWWYISGGSANSSSVKMSAALTLASSAVKNGACSVNTDSQNLTVQLPAAFSAALGTVGATANQTPFSINFTCLSSNQKLVIAMTASNPSTSVTGVVLPTTGTGYASNVGVQILNGSGAAVNVRGSTQTPIAITAGTMSIPYFARYYRTGSPISAGQVSATITFVVTYQ